MNNFNFQENWWIYVIAVVAALLGFSKRTRNDVVDKFIDVIGLIKASGEFLKNGSFNILLPRAKTQLIPISEMPKAFRNVLASLNRFLTTTRNALINHTKNIISSLEPDEKLRNMKVFGLLFQLFFLCIFGLSDAIQLVNAYLIIFPQDVFNVPDFLKNLTISLLMSSVGIAVAASFILADFHGITHFGKWNTLTGKFRKVIYSLVWIALITALFIDGITAISKVKSVSSIIPLLPDGFLNFITVATPIAAVLVIIPMLIITFMFLEGFVGFAIVYSIIVWLLSLILGLLHLIVIGVIAVILFGFTYVIEFVFRALMWIIVILTFIVAYLLLGSGITIVEIFKLIQVILNMVYFPIDAIVAWISKLTGGGPRPS